MKQLEAWKQEFIRKLQTAEADLRVIVVLLVDAKKAEEILKERKKIPT